MKEQFRETNVGRNVVDVQFGVFSLSDIQQASEIQVCKSEYYQGGNSKCPVPYGVLDTRMGTGHKDVKCSTCSKSMLECVGHFGYVELEVPVFHVGYLKNVIHLLQNICKTCSHVLLKPEIKQKLLEEAKRKTSSSFLAKKNLYRRVNEFCKKVSICPNCGALNGVVKKISPYIKIAHEKFRHIKKGNTSLADFQSRFDNALELQKDLESILPANPVEYIQAKDAYELFANIPLDTLPLFCMDDQHSHPKDLILWRLPVAPCGIRPSVISDLRSGTNEDDVSDFINEILLANNEIAKQSNHKSFSEIIPAVEYMQIKAALLINSEMRVPNEYRMFVKRNARGFIQRLKGKQGRFRGNLSGKRVDFTGRTVISPDPNLRITEVGVPVEVAKDLTYPETVTPHNIKIMRELVKNGPSVHPGAIYIEQRHNPGLKKALRFTNRERMASELQFGDVIERHLMDGDIVLFNRQPSLHKMSIMSHRAKVLPWRTFRFNECVCTPYNADFDGDEMNLHLPQTEEARAEAMVLMTVKANLVTPRNGSLIVGATQDFLTGCYLLTQKDQFFDKEKTMELIASILCGREGTFKVELPKPAIIYPIQLWTGKQIFSTILCPFKENNFEDFPCCNLIVKRKGYTGDENKEKNGKIEEFCTNEGWIIFRNSELIAGSLDKSILGSGSKKNLFYTILKDCGKDKAADAMWRVARLSVHYLINKGFSIGIGDVMPGKGLLNRKRDLLEDGYEQCNKLIEQLKNNDLTCQPGCSPEETLEHAILGKLSRIRDEAGKACVMELHKSNVALIMAISGSKGSFINISQMIACVGQQAISGKRVPDGFENRALPHFDKGSKEPAAKGFVSNSFFSGISPTEFFFHTMAGREGLVDTAVKTAETGYMQRRLMKSLEDLYVAYDMTVRNSTQDVIQFQYGGDSLDPSELEEESSPLDFRRVLNHIRALNMYPKEKPLSGAEATQLAEQYWNDEEVSKLSKALSPDFKKSIISFISEYGKIIDLKRGKLPAKKERKKKKNEIDAFDHVERLTLNQLIDFLSSCLDRYQASVMEPGTAVGALCAQSIGEPGTQMTLKTFHFAGVAAMNITQGVPRILEIINASQNISTPVIIAKLKCNTDIDNARQVKSRVEKTLLGEVCSYFQEIYLPDDCFLLVKLDMQRIGLLKLEVDARSIKYSICTSKLRIKENDIEVVSNTILRIRPSRAKTSTMFYQLQHLKQYVPGVVIKGLPTVTRAVINEEKNSKNHGQQTYELLVEGNNLREVIATFGIEGTKCKSNNTCEMFRTLGIEAARSTIINEISHTMAEHGLSIDHRHVMMLADLMTCRGQVLGITRHGLSKMKESVLMLASFEKTADHLFDAAYHGQNNPIDGVSDCIIMGKPMNVGTGLFRLLHKHKMDPTTYKKSDSKDKLRTQGLVFDHPQFHIPMAESGWHSRV